MARRIFRSIGRSEKGSTLVEFAILAPVMIFLICAAIEFGRMRLVQSTLDIAVSTAAREALVNLKVDEEDRDEQLRESIAKYMEPFTVHPDREMEIETKVYRTFGSSYPESFEDRNGNGVYDGPDDDEAGEPFDDRNKNNVYDEAIQEDGVLGGPGDVVSYKVTFPIKLLFTSFTYGGSRDDAIELTSEVVMRNEPVRGSQIDE